MRTLGLGLALALVGCGSGRGSSARPSGPGVATCTAYSRVVEQEQAIAAGNAAALTRAVTEANLTEAQLDVDSFAVTGDGGAESLSWQVVEASGHRSLLSPVSLDVCGAGNPWHLALDGRGGVVVLMLQLRQVARHQLTVCGCEVDVPLTCGGAAPQPVRWRWTLPAGLSFAGPLSLVVDDEASARTYAGRGDGQPCPPPTAVP